MRLSAAVASNVAESIYLPSRVLNDASHSLTAIEPTSTATKGMEKAIAVGCRILSTEDFANSKPMTIIRAATASPDRYSYRA